VAAGDRCLFPGAVDVDASPGGRLQMGAASAKRTYERRVRRAITPPASTLVLLRDKHQRSCQLLRPSM